jgi:RNA polymerase primary sigma factor
VEAATGGDRSRDDGAPAYFLRLRESPLLTPEEELDLFRRMNFLKFLANRVRAALVPPRPQLRLIQEVERLLAEAGEVRERIVSANLRLVVSIARRFVDEDNDFEDLVSDGNLTLIGAVEKFDYARGFRFSTYATHAIQRDFFRQVRKRRLNRTRFQLGADELIVGKEDDSPSETDANEHFQRCQRLVELMERELSDRERYIVRMRYGLDHDTGRQTLATIGAKLGVSKERIRQLEIHAIETLQRASRTDPVSSTDSIGRIDPSGAL